jgi:hypothetical protein
LFADGTFITITYQSNRPINIVLGSTDFPEGGGYMYELEAANSSKTKNININDFEQPEWSIEEYGAIPNNKSKIGSIIIEAEDVGITTGTITKLALMSGSPTSIIKGGNVKSQSQRLSAGINIVQNRINLNIANQKVVTLKISDIRGRQLLLKDITLNASGIASLNIPSSIAKNQTLIVNVKSKNGLNYSQKILLK